VGNINSRERARKKRKKYFLCVFVVCVCAFFVVFEVRVVLVEEMPLVRYEAWCEPSLVDPELYRKALVRGAGGDDSSRALLEAVAGLSPQPWLSPLSIKLNPESLSRGDADGNDDDKGSKSAEFP
jgi:hypothetical protein